MRNSMMKGKGLWVLAVVLAAVLLVIACAPAATGPTEKILQIGNLVPLTGGSSIAEQPCFQAEQDYIRYFNENNGIPGATVKLAWKDVGTVSGGTDVSRFINDYRSIVEGGRVPLIHSGASSGLEACKADFERDQIPALTQAPTAPQISPAGWIYSFWALESEACAVELKYFMDNWHEARPPKLQFFVMDGPWGRAVPDEVTEYAKSLGFEVLPLEVAPYVVIDSTPQWLRIKERGADLVWIQMIIQGAGPVLRDAERLGIAGKMQFAGTQWILGDPLIQYAPVGAEGFLAPCALPWIDETDIPGIKTMEDTEMKYHGQVYRGPEYTGGWVYSYVECEALKRAVDQVGYENVNGVAVKTALESMKDFDVDGLTKITWGPEDRRGVTNYALYQIQGGKIVRVSDYLETPILAPP